MDPKQVLPDVLPGKANIMPNPFASKMSGGADTRPEQVMPGFNGESVSPGKAIFMGGKRRTRRNKTTNKRRRQHNKKQSQRKKQRR
jgi:hypothetical protein